MRAVAVCPKPCFVLRVKGESLGRIKQGESVGLVPNVSEGISTELAPRHPQTQQELLASSPMQPGYDVFSVDDSREEESRKNRWARLRRVRRG
jgi:hypothetical protein